MSEVASPSQYQPTSSIHNPGSLPPGQMEAPTALSATHGHPVEPSRSVDPEDPLRASAAKTIIELIRRVEEANRFSDCDCSAALDAFLSASESERYIVAKAIYEMVTIGPWGFSSRYLFPPGSPHTDLAIHRKSLADLCDKVKSRHFRILAGIYCVCIFGSDATSHYPFAVSRCFTEEQRVREEMRRDKFLTQCKAYVSQYSQKS